MEDTLSTSRPRPLPGLHRLRGLHVSVHIPLGSRAAICPVYPHRTSLPPHLFQFYDGRASRLSRLQHLRD